MERPDSSLFASVLVDLLRLRKISPTAPGLRTHLRTRNVVFNEATVRNWIKGTRRPHGTNLELLLRALDATVAERALVARSLSIDDDAKLSSRRESHPKFVSVVDAAGGTETINAGRGRESVLWRYFVGAQDDLDRCEEIRRTIVGQKASSPMSFGIGEFTKPTFALEDVASLDVTVKARVLGPDSRRVGTIIVGFQFEPGRSQIQLVVLFSDVKPQDKLEWIVGYRWPGLWRSLRANGEAVGRQNFGTLDIETGGIEIVADAKDFGDLYIDPLEPESPQALATTSSGNRVASWILPSPRQREIRYRVLSPARFISR